MGKLVQKSVTFTNPIHIAFVEAAEQCARAAGMPLTVWLTLKLADMTPVQEVIKKACSSK